MVSNGSTSTAGGLTYSGTGVLSLSGANTYAGATTLTSGTLNINNAGSSGTSSAIGTGTFNINGGTINNTTGGLITLSTNNPITFGGNFAFTGSQNLTFGTGAITNAGSRTITLNGTTSTLAFGGIMTNTVGAIQTTTVNGAGNTLALGGYALSNSSTSYIDVISGTGNVTISGVVSNGSTSTAGGLTYSGTGVLTLSGTNTYAGATAITAAGGTLKLNNVAALGATTNGTSITSGAVLDLNGINYASAEALTVNGTGISDGGAIINSSASPATYTGTLAHGSDFSIIANAGDINITGGNIPGNFNLTLGGSGNGNVSSSISSGGANATVTKIGTGTWTLSSASNNYPGTTTISAGTLKLGSTTALGASSGATVSTSGAAIDLNGQTLTAAIPLTLNGTGVSSAGALMNSGAAASYSGAITLGSASSIGTAGNITLGSAGVSGGFDLTKVGTGTLSLGSGTATLGALTISAGGLTSTSTTLNLTGNFSNSGTFTHNGGTVNFNGAGQTLSAAAFNHLTLSGSGTKTVGAGTTVAGNLSLSSGVVANLTGTANTANALYLGGTQYPSGTWGATGSGASHINNTYFSGTGYVTITTAGGCTDGTWMGTASTDWNNATNWCSGTVPTASTAVVIPASGITNWPELSTGETGNCSSLTFSGVASRLNFTGGDLVVAGNVSFPNGIINSSTSASTLSVGGTWTGTGTTFTPGTYLTVDFTGASQTMPTLAFYNLTLSGSGADHLGAVTTINGSLTLSTGTSLTADQTTNTNLTVSGNLTVGANTTLTISDALGTTPVFTVSGSTNITGTLNLNHGAKVFTGDVTVNSSGTFTKADALNSSFDFYGSIANNSGTFTIIELGGAVPGEVTFYGSGKTLSGSISVTNATFNSGATYTNNGTFTVSNYSNGSASPLSGTGSFTNGASATLNIGGACTISTLNATATGNTVNYSGAAQTVLNTTYKNLTLSGSGAKTISTTTGTSLASGILNIDHSSSGTATASVTNANTGVHELRFNGITQVAGTWGSNSSSATNQDNTNFTSTSSGYLNTATGVASQLVYTTVPSTGTAGTPFSVTVQSQDANGNQTSPSSNTTITLSKATGSGTLSGVLTGTISTSGNSVTIATPVYSAADIMTLTASATAGMTTLAAVTSGSISFAAGTATIMSVNAGNGQSAISGAAVATSPSVIVKDASNNPVSGITITFAVASGGGSATGLTTTTNGSGIATVGSWTLGTTAGTNTLAATGTGLSGSPITFTATGTIGALDHFTISAISSPQTVGTAITGITLTAQDVNNNTLSTYTGTVVFSGTAGITGTSASFTGGVLTGVSVTPTAAGTAMTLVVTGSAKTGTTSFTVIPLAPTGSTAQTVCAGSTISNLSATGTSIQWYNASTGGSLYSSGTALADNTHYYASQTVGGSESTTRLNVLVTLTASGTWLGTASPGNWSDPANWCGGVPTSGTNVVITAGTTYSPVVDISTAACNNLTINSAALLTIAAAQALTVSGVLTNNATATGLVLSSGTSGTASLIHATNTIAATVERYISGAAEDWHFLSSPMSAQSITGDWLPSGTYGGSGGTGYDLYLWDEPLSCWKYKANAKWDSLNSGGNNFTIARGYLYSVQATTPTKSFVGNLNNGSQSIALKQAGTDITLKGFNLVGNPYPSSIDWQAAAGWSRSALTTSGNGYDMWIWNQSANNYGVCNSYGGAGTNSVTRYIAPMQGFFVRAASGGSLGFSNAIRVHDGASTWKSARMNSEVISAVVLSERDGTFDEARLLFGYPDGVIGTAKLFSPVSSAPSLYLNYGKENLTVRYLTDTLSFPQVPLLFKAGREGAYRLNFLFDPVIFNTVILEDKQTTTMQDLRIDAAYRFNASVHDQPNRFVLHLVAMSSATPTELPARITTDGSRIVVDLTQVPGETRVSVYDVLGRKRFEQLLAGESLQSLNFTPGTQLLILKLENPQGKLVRKIVCNSSAQ